MESEFKDRVEAELKEPYRLPVSVQLFLLVFVSLITIGLLYRMSVPSPELLIKSSIYLCVLSLVYPLFIHIDSRITQVLSFAFFGAGFFSIVFLTLRFMSISLRGALLSLAFLEIIGIQLLHHTTRIFRVRKSKEIYALDTILSGFFFSFMFLFFWKGYEGGPLDWFVSALLSIGLTMIFFYAIMPEREF